MLNNVHVTNSQALVVIVDVVELFLVGGNFLSGL